MQTMRDPLVFLRSALAGWGLAVRDRRFVAASTLGTVLVAAVIGIPTDVLANPWYTRMTAINADQYVWWAAVSLLSGMLLGTYALSWGSRTAQRGGLGGGILGYLAVGCPICNKLIVAVLGTSGALSYFAPLQPALGLAAVLLALTGLFVRLRGLNEGCPFPAPESLPS